MNKEIMAKHGFEAEVIKVDQGICPLCNQKPGLFKDKQSEAEFKISGLCQKCQDEVFDEQD